jgi:GNAT superfamily N-acetyltransferase
MSPVLVRKARAEDLARVLELYAQPAMDDGRVLDEASARDIWSRFAGYPDYHLYVAELDGNVLGTFALLIMDNLAHQGTPSGIVEDVAVAPGMQGQGIGTAMMEHASAICAERGCYKMVLSSNLRRGPAHQFYEKIGFQRHGYSFVIAP